MNKFTACIFPDTLPDEKLIFPLVQVFGQLVYMQAVENEPPEDHSASALIADLQQHGALYLFTPTPLGEQRERFLALMNDMKNRRDDYTSQLSMLTLAGLNRQDRTETKHSILANLLQRSNIAGKKEEDALLLWQSRLILKLGEFIDTEQLELNQALRKISGQQDALLAELRDEEEDMLSSLTASIQESSFKTEGILRHRLKAWSRLYFNGTPPVPPQIYITSHGAAIDTLLEVYEKNHRQSAQQVASLELAVSSSQSSPQPLPLQPLVEQCPALHTALVALTAGDALQGPDVPKRFSECAADWSQCLANQYPVSQFGRGTLNLFLFPETTIRQLFLNSFCGGSPSSDTTSKNSSEPCVIGWLETN
jgi:hypothetical protein